MCGRYSLFTDQTILLERFSIQDFEAWEWQERYNIAPSQQVLAVVGSPSGNRAGMLRWGLIPSWAKDEKIGYKMINARAETISEKPSFRKLLTTRRCLVIADGFYEWKKEGKEKQPYRFQLKSRQPFAFAGLWDRWDDGGKPVHTCTIITTEANEKVEEVHDRMPVILTSDAEKIWLDHAIRDPFEMKSVLAPYSADKMEAYPVSMLVNHPLHDSRDILNSR